MAGEGNKKGVTHYERLKVKKKNIIQNYLHVNYLNG